MPLDLEFSAITEDDVGEVAQFLRTTFGAGEDRIPFRPDVIRWKSLEPHSLWSGSRGYVLRTGGRIVAHGCVMPARFMSRDAEITSACIVDWAADKAYPGSGVTIYQRIGRLTDTLIGVGGSDDAQRVLPRMGFQPRMGFLTHAEVTKPLAAFRAAGDTSVRGIARLARDVARGMQHSGGDVKGWSVQSVTRFDDAVAAVLPRARVICRTVCYRDAALLNYFLLCPAAAMRGMLFYREGTVAGYAILATVNGECRIAELWIASEKEEDWIAAYRLAFEAGGAEARVARVVSGAATPLAQRAAAGAGASLYGKQPVYVKDPRSVLSGDLDVALGMTDTDAFYL